MLSGSVHREQEHDVVAEVYRSLAHGEWSRKSQQALKRSNWLTFDEIGHCSLEL
jgi:hypothetical protein